MRQTLIGQGQISIPYFPWLGANMDAHSDSTVPLNFADAIAEGLVIARHAFKWNEIEPSVEGTFSWTKHDAVVAGAAANGVKLLAPLTNRPAWTGAGGTVTPPPDFSKAYTFMSTTVARYRGRDIIWEIWNEPNINSWAVADYITFVIAASAAIKAADPNAKVATALARIPVQASGVPQTFHDAFLSNASARAALDYFGWHAYCRPASPEAAGSSPNGAVDDAMRNTFTWLPTKGWTGPTIVGEGGWPTVETGSGNAVSEANQARYLVRHAIICRTFSDRFYFYRFYSATSPFNADLDSEGIVYGNGSLKPSGRALKTLTDITRLNVAVWAEVASGPVWVYRLERAGGQFIWILWTDALASSNYTLTGLPDLVRRTSLYGVQDIVATSGGSLVVTATPDPVYIEAYP